MYFPYAQVYMSGALTGTDDLAFWVITRLAAPVSVVAIYVSIYIVTASSVGIVSKEISSKLKCINY